MLQDSGSRIAFDPNHRPRRWPGATEARKAYMRMTAISGTVLPSFDDERALFADEGPLATAQRYADAGVSEVLVKNGSEAGALACEGQVLSLPLPRFTQPVDTTGAGDSFNAAYLVAPLQGASPVAANGFAQGIAANTLSRKGALVDPLTTECAFPGPQARDA